MASNCKATKRNGRKCGQTDLSTDGYCIYHDKPFYKTGAKSVPTTPCTSSHEPDTVLCKNEVILPYEAVYVQQGAKELSMKLDALAEQLCTKISILNEQVKTLAEYKISEPVNNLQELQRNQNALIRRNEILQMKYDNLKSLPRPPICSTVLRYLSLIGIVIILAYTRVIFQ